MSSSLNTVLKSLLIVAVAAIALSAGYFVQRGSGPRSVEAPGQQPATSVTSTQLLDLDGKKKRISDWQGKVVVVNFWATWCAPCREEIPALVRTQAKLGPKGLQIVGIALDELDRVKPFATEMGVNYPILLAGVEGLELVRAAGNEIGALPFTVFIDRSGKFTKAELGGVNEEKLEKRILPLL